jgi:membrane protein involved in colicin uptake
MGEPVVLPKFQLHGDKPHWAVRAAWISGGVLLLSIAGLVAVIMHRHTLEVEAHVAKQEALARVKAEAESRVAAAAAAAKAAKEAELADKRAALAAAEAAKAAQNAPAGAADDTAAKGTKTSHRSHSGHGGKASKLAAKTGGGVKTDSSTKSSGSGKPKSDPIDDLLKKMK